MPQTEINKKCIIHWEDLEALSYINLGDLLSNSRESERKLVGLYICIYHPDNKMWPLRTVVFCTIIRDNSKNILGLIYGK